MRRLAVRSVMAVGSLLLVPLPAFAQAAITGVVRDASGAVLPGVTVEAASPALIEKVRTVVTDGSGQYRIVDLRPGTYAVTFSLSGFNTVKREGIELTGSFTAPINVELGVGELTETITVSGASPLVDVQGVTQQRTITADTIAALPTGRAAASLAVLVPGIVAKVRGANPMDVGGTGALQNIYMTIHGSSYLDQRMSVDGAQLRNLIGEGNATNFAPDMGSTQEMTVEYGAGSVEQFTGGVRINFIPREGGNTFRGSFFATGLNSKFQANNVTEDLKARGLTDPNALDKQYDFNPTVGGPIILDRLWFYAGARWQTNENFLAGMYENLNAGDPNAWLYAPDYSKQAHYTLSDRSVNTRLTIRASERNKVGLYYQHAHRFWQQVDRLISPEAFSETEFPVKHLGLASWSSPVTNRLLLEARGMTFADSQQNERIPELTRVVEQAGIFPGLTYRGSGYGRTEQPKIWEVQATASYVTGAHALKIGVNDSGGTVRQNNNSSLLVSQMRFNNGVPNQLTQQATPNQRISTIRELAIYVQDRWTINRLTLNGGVRFDQARTIFPEQHVGPMPLAPALNITFPKTDWANLKDLSPRVGATYDLFGNGKTALKTSYSKYLAGMAATVGNPVSLLSLSTTRAWTDVDRDYVPDCDLISPLANAECGPMANRLFGQPVATDSQAPELIRGWDKRLKNSEFSVSVQHELIPRMAVNIGYFRRWYGNLQVTDNLAVGPSDFTEFSVVAPLDPRLPNGGGYVIDGLYNLNPDKVGQVNNLTTFAENYGEQLHTWQGWDASVNLRASQDVLLQAGYSGGKTLTDNCEIMAKLPEIQANGYETLSFDRRAVSAGLTNNPFCRIDTPFIHQFKGLGTYTIPRVDIQLAGTLQTYGGPEQQANIVVSNAQVQPSLGRPLSGGAANVTVPLIEPGSQYGEWATLLDLRVGKVFRVSRLRTAVNLDVYNVLNSNSVTLYNHQYGTGSTWLQPQQIVAGRLFKFSAQVDF